MKASLNRNIPWNFLNVTKLTLIVALLILTAVDFIKAITKQGDPDLYPVDIWSPVIKFVTFVST